MEAKDLMIGDWVNIAVEEYNNPTRIREIGSFWVKVIKDEMEYGNILVTPIPLTAKILKKLGWEKCNIDVVDDDEQYGCAYGSFYVTWWRKVKLLSCYFEDKNAGLHYEMISELPTKHVHQLQHALKLCGIDKEIEL